MFGILKKLIPLAANLSQVITLAPKLVDPEKGSKELSKTLAIGSLDPKKLVGFG